MKTLGNISSFGIILFLLVFSSCKKDACEDVTCLNNSVCNDGTCDCPEGYGGLDCGIELVPRKIVISNIKVTRMPATPPQGFTWDLTDDPDIYTLIATLQSVIWYSPYYENADPSVPWDFTPSPTIDITGPDQLHEMVLVDYDHDSDNDFMGSVFFIPYIAGRNFPQQRILDEGGDVAFELTLSYSW